MQQLNVFILILAFDNYYFSIEWIEIDEFDIFSYNIYLWKFRTLQVISAFCDNMW